jgi:hypothetical protein
MITSITTHNKATAAHALHAVRTIAQKGLSIRALTFCKVESDAGPGIHQVADWAFDGRPKYGDIAVCQECAQAVIALVKAPPR